MNMRSRKHLNEIDEFILKPVSPDERVEDGKQRREAPSNKKSDTNDLIVEGQCPGKKGKGDRQQRVNKRLEKIYRYGALIEAKPGKFIRLIGSERARQAILRGTAKRVQCDCCRNHNLVHRSARVLYCRGCKHLTPLAVVSVSDPPNAPGQTMLTRIENIQLLLEDQQSKEINFFKKSILLRHISVL